MGWLRVRHPATGGTARIPESALPHHLLAGWELAPEPSLPAAVPEEAATENDGTPGEPPSTEVPPPGGPQETGSESW